MALFVSSSGYLRGSLRQQAVVPASGGGGLGNGPFGTSSGTLNTDKLDDVEVGASEPQVFYERVVGLSSFAYPNILTLLPPGQKLVGLSVFAVGSGGTGGPGSVSPGGITTTGGGGGGGSIAAAELQGLSIYGSDYTSIPVTFTVGGGQVIIQVQGINTTTMTVQSTTFTVYPGQNGDPDGMNGGGGGLIPSVAGSLNLLSFDLFVGQIGGQGTSYSEGFGVIGAGGVSAGPPINQAPTQAGPGIMPGFGGGSAGGFTTPTVISGGGAAFGFILKYVLVPPV